MAILFSGFIVLATAVCGLFAVLLYKIRRPSLCVEASALPGPQTIPIFGNALYFSGNANILDKLTELMKSYPSPFRIWVANKLVCFVHEAEHIQTVLVSPKAIEKAEMYRMAHSWLGDGLLTAPEKRWRLHRRLIMPTFNTRILESFVEVFAKQSEVMTTIMKKELQGGEFDISRYVSLATVDILCETVMGVELNVQTEDESRFVASTTRSLEVVCKRIFTVWLYPDFIFNRSKLGKELRECLEYVQGMTNDIIEKKKSTYSNANQVENDDAEERPVRRKAFMDLLMELSNDGTKLTDDEIREEINTMMIAGFDSTATVNSFILTILAMYPEVQERVYEELCEIYGDEVTSDTPVKHEDLNRMEYLERVIKETLRLFPLAPIIARKVNEDLKIDEYTLPKGSTAVVSIFKIHRSEKYWPEPLKFDPDRFLPENVAKRHSYCYIPFSGGPRNCIGMKYAIMSMKALVTTVLRRYVLTKDNILDIKDIKLKLDILLRPADPLTIKISERRAVNK